MNTIAYLARVAAVSLVTIVTTEICLAKDDSLKSEITMNMTNVNRIVDQLEKAEFTGAIAVANQNDDLIFAGFGDKATVNGRPESNTLVDIGSITKTVTAVAALKLVEQGKLSLSDRISKFFPYAPEEKLGITIHQLLTHSSGLPPYVAKDGDGISKDEFLKRTMNSQLIFKPGEKYEYSNVGYSLIAVIIEQVSNISYEKFIRETLLKDISKSSIGYEAAYASEDSMLTPGGETIAQNSWGGSPKWELIGNGGLIATPTDLVTFLKKLDEGKIISSDALNLLRTPYIREGQAPSHYGYGVVVEDDSKYGRIYWHNGGNGIFSATWTHYSDYDLIIVTTSNSPKLNSDKAESIVLKEVLRHSKNEK